MAAPEATAAHSAIVTLARAMGLVRWKAFTALSNGRTSALCSLLRNLVGIAVFLFALPHFLGARGIWLAVPASDLVALAVSLSCLRGEAASILGTYAHRYPRLFARTREGNAET